MERFVLGPQKDYGLLDSGDGEKLERFGKYVLSRPDPNALWSKKMIGAWKDADAIFHAEATAKGSRWENRGVKEPWVFRFEETRPVRDREGSQRVSISNGIKMSLYLSPFKHVGVFPEQIINWQWFGELIASRKSQGESRKLNVLNLFGYTGGATLYAASKGAKVTHVDASRPSVTWARENQKLSGLESAPIRWIVDDARKFVAREIKRGVKYDAVIMDPPAFGRDPKGKVFKFEKDVPELIELTSHLLTSHPIFFLFNSYSLGYSPTVIKNMLAEILPIEKIECGELEIEEKSSGMLLPAGVFGRYKN